MKKSTVFNFFFKFFERSGTQIISLIITIILARILDVETYGIIEIILIFVTISQIFVQNGLNAALIQRNDIKEQDFTASLCVNLGMAATLYLIIFIAAPFIEEMYGLEGITLYLRVLGLVLFPNAYNSIQNAFMQRNFMFRTQMTAVLTATVLGGVLGVYLAYKGFGVWAYVMYQLLISVLTPLFASLIVEWKPGRVDDFRRVLPIVKYGSRILGANLLDSAYVNISSLVIGKVYSKEDLAFYGKAKQFPDALVTSLNGSIQSVLFPYLSREQDNLKKMKDSLRATIQMTSLIMFPIIFGLMAISNNLIIFLLGEKWLPSAQMMILISVTYAFWPILTANAQALNAVGKSGTYFIIEALKKAVNLLALFICIFLFTDVTPVLIGQIIIIPLLLLLAYIPNKKLFNYTLSESLGDYILPLIGGVVMFAVVYLFGKVLPFAAIVNLLIQVVLGIIVYFIFHWLTNSKNMRLATDVAKMMLRKGEH